MNKILIKIMLRDTIFSAFFAGLVFVLLVWTFSWCYSVLKTIYAIDELTDQNFNNKEVIMTQTASNQAKENLLQPAEIAATQAPSERDEKVLLSVDTVSKTGAQPIVNNKEISKQTPVSREHLKPVSGQAADKIELRTAATADHNLNNSAENSSTDKISTFNVNTSKNYKSVRATEFYQQITGNQQQTKEKNDSQAEALSSNNPVEKPAADSMNSGADQNEKDIYDRVVRLQLEIERLDERIASGLSDSDFNYFMQLNSPVFVIHDSERRVVYQSILEKMLSDTTLP